MALPECKVVFLGDTGVGKTSLVRRYTSGTFEAFSEPTIGAAFVSKVIMADKAQIKLHWDTAGQEKYHSLMPMYYRGAHAAIVVMDVTRPKSLDTLRTWINELRSNGPDDIILAVAANKTDLPRSVSAAECAAAAEDFGAMYFETSAKEDLNVNDMFLAVANAMPDTSAVEAVDPTVDLASTSTGGRGSGGSGKSGCC